MCKLNQPGSTGRYSKTCLVVLALALVLLSSACAIHSLGKNTSEKGALNNDEMIHFINEYSELKEFYDNKNNANSTSAGPPAGCDFYFAKKNGSFLPKKRRTSFVLMNEKLEVFLKFSLTDAPGARAFSLPDKDCNEIFYIAYNDFYNYANLLRIKKTGRDFFMEHITNRYLSPLELGIWQNSIILTSPGGELAIYYHKVTEETTFATRYSYPCTLGCTTKYIEKAARKLLAHPDIYWSEHWSRSLRMQRFHYQYYPENEYELQW